MRCMCCTLSFNLFFFNDTATTEIYTRSLVGSSDVYKRQVLIDTFDQLVKSSPSVRDALLQTGRERLRPVLLLSLIHISEPTRPY